MLTNCWLADQYGGASTFYRQRAVSLLEEATQFLREYSDSPSNRNVDISENLPAEVNGNRPQNGQNFQTHSSISRDSSSANRNVPQHDQRFQTQSSRDSSVNDGRLLETFRSLFAPYGRENTSMQSASDPGPSGHPASQRRKRNTTQMFFKRDTWTHEFFCVADKERMTVPSRSLKSQLQQAGLGRKKVCFNGRANATEVKPKLEEIYPKLIAGGGFEILRRGPSPSELSVIPPPPNSGYSVPFLRDCAGLGQAIAFIRPLQCNLNLDPIKPILEHCQVCTILQVKSDLFNKIDRILSLLRPFCK